MNLKITTPLLALSLLVLGACSDTTNFNFEQDIEDAADAAPPPDIPFPNAVLFAGSDDTTLNITLDDDVAPNDFSNPQVALNAIDGFSITQPLLAGFDVPEGTMIDPESVILGETVFVFEVSTTGAPQFEVTGILSELVAGQVSVVAGADSVVVVPVVPLRESTSYMVVITDGVTILGAPDTRPVNSVYRLVSGALELTGALAGLETLRVATSAMLDATAGQDFAASDVINIFTTRTQSITAPMEAVSNAAVAGAITMLPAGMTTQDINAASPGDADLFVGTLDVPYYQTAPAGPNDQAAITSFWRAADGGFITAANPMPEPTSIQTIPVLMTVPNASSGQTMPPAGWPVAIFVHGITNDRTFMLAVADVMANAGFAVIAIDQVMHGITDVTNGLSAANPVFPNDVERHFGIDLVNNATGAPGPDGFVDSSGTHFFSPAQLLNTRDNLRQSVSDLLVLSESIANVASVPLDASRQALIGHSLGGTTATTFAAFTDNLSSVTLAMPAAGLVETIIASPEFSGPVLAGLEAADENLVPGTPQFASFVVAAQTVIDAADPINFAARAAAANPIHMIEVVGDQVVPNIIDGAPLAGTEQLARVMGLVGVSANTSGSALVRYIAGDHGSILSSAASPEAFAEMQIQTATFAASGGTSIVVSDPTVVQPAQ